MIYLNNNTSAQTINIPYLEMSDSPVPINPKIQPYKNVDITTNGDYEVVPDDPYNSIKKVGVNVNLPITSGSVIFTPSSQFEYYNTFYASGFSWSALTVDADAFANQMYKDGYEYAQRNIEVEAVELSVSANGIYNATIGQYGEGYIKKVTVNVPSSGVTEPFFGKWADFTNVGFNLSLSAVSNTYIELECLAPSGTQVLYLFLGGGGWRFPIQIRSFYYYGEPRLLVEERGNISFQDKINFNRPIKSSLYFVGDPNEAPSYISAQAIGVTRNSLSGETNIPLHIPMLNKTYEGLSAMNAYIFYDYDDHFNPPQIVQEKVRYFKSLRIYDANNNVTKLIMPRSDGKMWDVIANQESDIDWIKSDGTHPKIFNTLYEWDIPTV